MLRVVLTEIAPVALVEVAQQLVAKVSGFGAPERSASSFPFFR